MDTAKLWDFTQLLVDNSAEVILSYWDRDDLEVVNKGDDTPVTLADKGAEEVMRALINQHYPEHGIIGEEYGNENEDADFVWVLDPIDGTFSFAHNIPLFGTLICLKYQGKPILGAINQPVLKKCLIGDGEVTKLNGKIVTCSDTTELDRATLLATDNRTAAEYQPNTHFTKLTESVRVFRTWGDAYGYLMVGCGDADIMTDPIVNEWDFIGHVPIIRGAGGIITDWEGKDPIGGSSVVCANKHLHPKVMEVLHG
ncbi:MAG: inositol monophosphatase family protein [Opitutales bacterium]